VPELPEVETIRRQLAPALTGRRFGAVEKVEPFMLLDGDAAGLCSVLPGKRALGVERQGKFMVIPLSGDWFLTVHLGMTGQLLVFQGEGVAAGTGSHPYRSLEPTSPHDRFVFTLEPGADAAQMSLVFRDMRKFGRLHLTEGGPPKRLGQLGPDAWRGDWTSEDLARGLRGRTVPIKAFLLDQRHLAGIGNIYADEILFGAAVSPLRPAGSLSLGEIETLAGEIRARLDEGVRLRGCTVSDFVDTKGRSGSFQDALRAYGRQGQVCTRCGATLVRVIVAGRGTAYCPGCQF
jgi:formamidopyrimidine-DNA glycosylase